MAAKRAQSSPSLPRALQSGGRASNPRPQAWEACALPTELPPRGGLEGRLCSALCPIVPLRLRRRETPHPARHRGPRGGRPGRASRSMASPTRPRAARSTSWSRTGHYPPAPNASTHAAGPRRRRDELAGLAAGQGRGAELLGLVVRTVRAGGAAARARPSSSCARIDGTVLGVTYLDATPDSEQLRAPLPPHLPQPARQHRQLRPLLRHRPAAGELRHRPPGPDRRDLPRRDRRGLPQPRRWRWRRAHETRARAPWPARSPRCAGLRSPPLAPDGGARPPRASLTTIERQVMCVTCKIPLNVARVAAGRPRARLHPGTDRRGPRRSPDQARARRASTAPRCSALPPRAAAST